MPRLRKEVVVQLTKHCYSTQDRVAAAYLMARLADTQEGRDEVVESLRGFLVGRMGEAQKFDDFHRLWDKHGDIVLSLVYGRDGMGV